MSVQDNKPDININVSTGDVVSNPTNAQSFNLADGVQTEAEAVYVMEEEKLSTRKKMAWVSLVGIVGVLFGCFVIYFVSSFDLERFNALRPLIETCVFSLTSIVGFFIGSQTFADSKWSKEQAERN
jgi:hypothetical protein